MPTDSSQESSKSISSSVNEYSRSEMQRIYENMKFSKSVSSTIVSIISSNIKTLSPQAYAKAQRSFTKYQSSHSYTPKFSHSTSLRSYSSQESLPSQAHSSHYKNRSQSAHTHYSEKPHDDISKESWVAEEMRGIGDEALEAIANDINENLDKHLQQHAEEFEKIDWDEDEDTDEYDIFCPDDFEKKRQELVGDGLDDSSPTASNHQIDPQKPHELRRGTGRDSDPSRPTLVEEDIGGESDLPPGIAIETSLKPDPLMPISAQISQEHPDKGYQNSQFPPLLAPVPPSTSGGMSSSMVLPPANFGRSSKVLDPGMGQSRPSLHQDHQSLPQPPRQDAPMSSLQIQQREHAFKQYIQEITQEIMTTKKWFDDCVGKMAAVESERKRAQDWLANAESIRATVPDQHMQQYRENVVRAQQHVTKMTNEWRQLQKSAVEIQKRGNSLVQQQKEMQDQYKYFQYKLSQMYSGPSLQPPPPSHLYIGSDPRYHDHGPRDGASDPQQYPHHTEMPSDTSQPPRGVPPPISMSGAHPSYHQSSGYTLHHPQMYGDIPQQQPRGLDMIPGPHHPSLHQAPASPMGSRPQYPPGMLHQGPMHSQHPVPPGMRPAHPSTGQYPQVGVYSGAMEDPRAAHHSSQPLAPSTPRRADTLSTHHVILSQPLGRTIASPSDLRSTAQSKETLDRNAQAVDALLDQLKISPQRPPKRE
ncbi:hypothetical protein ADUPG1_007664 [Aduncisulcus paluster]|uniref:Phantastica n=1 Tax=Aduncisulcus paluster TaxID=2918883 RepID=A0ABQ5KP58_9EUKA|nr:hypothetical protein ADUPG1_007664 [Aduncisulcus paluster]